MALRVPATRPRERARALKSFFIMTEKVIEKERGEAKGEHTTLKGSLSRPGRYQPPLTCLAY
jgi:hypothetical protein